MYKLGDSYCPHKELVLNQGLGESERGVQCLGIYHDKIVFHLNVPWSLLVSPWLSRLKPDDRSRHGGCKRGGRRGAGGRRGREMEGCLHTQGDGGHTVQPTD